MYLKFSESNFDQHTDSPAVDHHDDDSTNTKELDILKQVELQFKELLEQSFEYEEKLDSKFVVIHELENKLNELTKEIEDIQNNNQTKELVAEQDDTELRT
jgi:vacuolar-type H+-ATPase subunit I/STV1